MSETEQNKVMNRFLGEKIFSSTSHSSLAPFVNSDDSSESTDNSDNTTSRVREPEIHTSSEIISDSENLVFVRTLPPKKSLKRRRTRGTKSSEQDSSLEIIDIYMDTPRTKSQPKLGVSVAARLDLGFFKNSTLRPLIEIGVYQNNETSSFFKNKMKLKSPEKENINPEDEVTTERNYEDETVRLSQVTRTEINFQKSQAEFINYLSEIRSLKFLSC